MGSERGLSRTYKLCFFLCYESVVQFIVMMHNSVNLVYATGQYIQNSEAA